MAKYLFASITVIINVTEEGIYSYTSFGTYVIISWDSCLLQCDYFKALDTHVKKIRIHFQELSLHLYPHLLFLITCKCYILNV